MSADPSHEKFTDLNLNPGIIAAVTKLGFDAPTPIQAKAIPLLLEGRDLVGRARTGSGKTAAFGLPLVHKLSQPGTGVRALVLAPTRELALQITAALRSYATELRVEMVTLYGGSPYQPQLSALRRGVDVVVGTPGRVIDHLGRGSLDLSTVELVVVDEADEMLRMGFIDDVTQLLQATPETRQVALFSATMPPMIRKVAEKCLRSPLEVHVEQQRLVVEHIEQSRIDVPEGHKVDTLVRVLKSKDAGATLIFARTRVACDELSESLRNNGFNAQALHGDMTQPAREQVLSGLRARRLDLVVATDVAARGIDVEHLTHVINFDLPDEVEVYVNRIGRTGRAGRKGVAINLVARKDLRLLARIEQGTKTRIASRPVPSDAQIVDRQRQDLDADLRAALEHQSAANATALVDALQQGEWTAENLVTAALGLLMQDRHLDIQAAPSDKPPIWARRSESRTQPKGRIAREGKAPREVNGRRQPVRDPAADQATLGAEVGSKHGIGPNDVVGALVRELGVPSRAIGRVTILDRRLTVTVSSEAAAWLARKSKVVFLRGNPVSFTHPNNDAVRDGSQRPQRAQRPQHPQKKPQRPQHPQRPQKPQRPHLSKGPRAAAAPARKPKTKAKAKPAVGFFTEIAAGATRAKGGLAAKKSRPSTPDAAPPIKRSETLG